MGRHPLHQLLDHLFSRHLVPLRIGGWRSQPTRLFQPGSPRTAPWVHGKRKAQLLTHETRACLHAVPPPHLN